MKNGLRAAVMRRVNNNTKNKFALNRKLNSLLQVNQSEQKCNEGRLQLLA